MRTQQPVCTNNWITLGKLKLLVMKSIIVPLPKNFGTKGGREKVLKCSLII